MPVSLSAIQHLHRKLLAELTRQAEIGSFVIRHDPLIKFIDRNLALYMRSRGIR